MVISQSMIYTCPMHPEVQEERPGVCPKCGMALERKSITGIERRTEYTRPMHPEIVRARRLSRATMRNIRQNLFFAFIYNSLGVPVAAGVLYPAFGLLLSPIIAAAAMSFSSVSVISNALRLRRIKI